MDTKHIHCMLEKIAEYGKCMMEEAVGAGNVNLDDAGKIVDMVKDLACAEKDALIAKAMRKEHEEDEAEEKYFLKMLKDEYKDEFKRMKEEYGDDEGERRFYDNYRYANGRFAPKGRGSYRPRSSGRRGYEESYPAMMEAYAPEYWRDMDRGNLGRMYYANYINPHGERTGYSEGGNAGSGSYSGNSGGNSSGGMNGSSSRGYSDGYDEGNRAGYQRGYEEGERSGRRNGGSSRYDSARRGYEESKQKNGSSQEGNSENMKCLEKVISIVNEDLKEYMPKMSQSEKAMARQKIESMAKTIQ